MLRRRTYATDQVAGFADSPVGVNVVPRGRMLRRLFRTFDRRSFVLRLRARAWDESTCTDFPPRTWASPLPSNDPEDVMVGVAAKTASGIIAATMKEGVIFMALNLHPIPINTRRIL